MLCTDKSNFEKNWQPALQFLEKNPNFTEADARLYIQSDNREDIISGYIIAAGLAYKEQDEAKLLSILGEAEERFADLPEILRIMRLSYHAIKGNLAQSAYDYAFKSFERKSYNQALEEMRIAFVADYRSGNNILNDPLKVQKAMTVYTKIADKLAYQALSKKREPNSKFRIGILVPNLVDASVAYSKRVIFFARYLDTSTCELKVYSSEDLAREGADSYSRGAKYIDELKKRKINFWAADPKLDMSKAAMSLARKFEEDSLDALLVQVDPAMPIACMATYMAKLDRKVHIHIGSAVYLPGLSYVLYDNATVMDKDSKSWPLGVGEQKLLRRGTDIAAIDKIVAKTKETLGLKEGDILVGCLSNHLVNRMSDEYKEIICKILESRDYVYFMPIGNIVDNTALKIFADKGLEQRLLLPGGRKDAIAYLKALDIYACEFPEGGSQALVEAMACELAIVAMHCGDDHHKSISAEVLGAEWAIAKYDLSEYEERLLNLIDDSALRQNCAKAMRARALKDYSVEDYINKVANMLKEINNVS